MKRLTDHVASVVKFQILRTVEAGAMATHAHGLDQALRVLEGWGLLRGRSS